MSQLAFNAEAFMLIISQSRNLQVNARDSECTFALNRFRWQLDSMVRDDLSRITLLIQMEDQQHP